MHGALQGLPRRQAEAGAGRQALRQDLSHRLNEDWWNERLLRAGLVDDIDTGSEYGSDLLPSLATSFDTYGYDEDDELYDEACESSELDEELKENDVTCKVYDADKLGDMTMITNGKGILSWFFILCLLVSFYRCSSLTNVKSREHHGSGNESSSYPSTPVSASSPKECMNVYKRLGCDLSKMTDPEIMGLNPTQLTLKHVKRRYFKLARIYHPDKYLKKSQKMKAHDVFLHIVNARDSLFQKLEREKRLPQYHDVLFKNKWM